MSGHRIITLDKSGKIISVEQSVYESDVMTLYEEVPEPPRRSPMLFRVVAFGSAFIWLAVALWLDRFA